MKAFIISIIVTLSCFTAEAQLSKGGKLHLFKAGFKAIMVCQNN